MTRSSSVPTDMVFNLAHEADVIALLRRIHLSILTIEEKNHLRDLVFATRFSNAVVDTVMMQTFASFGFAILFNPAAPVHLGSTTLSVSANNSALVRPSVLGFTRQSPQFVVPTVVQSIPTVPLPPPPPVAPEPVPQPSPVVQPIIPMQPDVIPQEAAVMSPTAEVAPAVSQPVTIPVVEPVVTIPKPITAPVASEVLPTKGTAAMSSGVAAERITAIKREVNAAVGNPVNLIDVNNIIGREYMNALLDAMKKTTGAVPAQEIERAMARLERAFEAVQGIIVPPPQPAASVRVEPLNQEAVPQSEAIQETSVVPPAPHAQPIEEVIEVRPGPGSARLVVETPVPAEVLPIPVEVPQRRTLSVTHAEEESVDMAEAKAVPVTSSIARPSWSDIQKNAPTQALPNSPSESETRIQETVHTMPAEPLLPTPSAWDTPVEPEALAPVQSGITSVAKELQLKELMEARTVSELAAASKNNEQRLANPLLADDVTSGLHQLLSEWKLFKSSGIFGTGPSGFDHPLYKKISDLNMAAVLAGRFEGATPEIKRSISDYMNGWRYEEGIMHEAGETFEMYLRRVIRRILDNQVKK